MNIIIQFKMINRNTKNATFEKRNNIEIKYRFFNLFDFKNITAIEYYIYYFQEVNFSSSRLGCKILFTQL